MKPLEYQLPHIHNLLTSMKHTGSVVDTSDTGTGKTFCASWCAARIGRPTLVVCPVGVINQWERTLEAVGVRKFDVVGYEYLTRSKKHSFGHWEGDKKTPKWVWDIDPGTVIIFDEAHRLRAWTSKTGRLCSSIPDSRHPVLLLSATLAEKPSHFITLSQALRVTKNRAEAWTWAQRFGWMRLKGILGRQAAWMDVDTQRNMLKIQNLLQDRMHGMRIASVKGFPERTIEVVTMGEDMDRAYHDFEELLQAGEEIPDIDSPEPMDPRYLSEAGRRSDVVDAVRDYVVQGTQCGIFLQFRRSVEEYAHALRGDAVWFHGGTPLAERQAAIDAFQRGDKGVLIATAATVGTGVDLPGRNLRVGFVSPGWNATQFLQTLGRFHRAGSAPCHYRVTFSRGGVEGRVASNLRGKLTNIALLNDSDLAVKL